MEINKKDLQKALAVVKPAVASTDIVDQATAFAFQKGLVVAYNEEISIQHPIDIDLEGSVKAEELYKYLSKLKAETIDMQIKEEDDAKILLLKSGRAKSGFAINTEIKIPIKKVKKDWHEISEDLLDVLNTAYQTVSNDPAMPMMQCVHINKDGFIEGSDGNKLYHAKIKTPIDTVLLFGSAIKEVLRLKPKYISKKGNWCHFKNDKGTVISCRTIQEEYTDTSEALKGYKKGVKFTFPDGILSILDKAQIFSEDNEDEFVTFEINKNKIVVSAKSNTAWFKEDVKVKSDAKFSFAIKPKLLNIILQLNPNCSYVKNKLIFKQDNWIYIVSLLAAKETEL